MVTPSRHATTKTTTFLTMLTSEQSFFTWILHRLNRGGASDRLLLTGLFFGALTTAIVLVVTISLNHATATPVRGGQLTEGIVGVPRFVNPALAITRADQDMTALIYSGLLRLGENGALEPDLAESVTVSEDGRTYTINLKKGLSFHDGMPLTTSDVAFTIGLIQDPNLKSPLRGNWNDVSINVIDEYTLEVSLEEAYAPFTENFTVGIMPKHLWSGLSIEQLPFSQYNTEPIGTGPLKIERIDRGATGLINHYDLVSFDEAQNPPNLSRVAINFYQNEAALQTAFTKREIQSTAYLPIDSLTDIDTSRYTIITKPLPRIFGVFFNQNRSIILRDAAVRKALSLAIDRDALVSSALYGYGIPTDSPVIPTENMLDSAEASSATTDSTLESAKETLRAAGWAQNSLGLWEKNLNGSPETLRLTIKTSNMPLFGAVGDYVAEQWRNLGVDVQVEQFEQSDLVQSVIRPRDFEGLLFGMDMNRTGDLYPFWHSSQKDDPGLNVTQYTNIAVDRLLEDARKSQDQAERNQKLAEAASRISAEYPATLLFAPNLTYVVDNSITVAALPDVHRQSDRFATISRWYANTDTLWSFFRNNTTVETDTLIE